MPANAKIGRAENHQQECANSAWR